MRGMEGEVLVAVVLEEFFDYTPKEWCDTESSGERSECSDGLAWGCMTFLQSWGCE